MKKKNWACNECNFQDYTDAVKEEELDNLQCSNCGCNEFHLVTKTETETKQTAMQRLIEQLQIQLDYSERNIEKNLGRATAFRFAMQLAVSLLPEERKEIDKAKQITEIEKLEAKIEVLKWVNPILVDDIVKINYKIEQLETLRDKLINELKLK